MIYLTTTAARCGTPLDWVTLMLIWLMFVGFMLPMTCWPAALVMASNWAWMILASVFLKSEVATGLPSETMLVRVVDGTSCASAAKIEQKMMDGAIIIFILTFNTESITRLSFGKLNYLRSRSEPAWLHGDSLQTRFTSPRPVQSLDMLFQPFFWPHRHWDECHPEKICHKVAWPC